MKTSFFLTVAYLGALLAFTPRADAVVYDLTGSSSTVLVTTSYGTAIFSNDFTTQTGTGVIDPFLSIQHSGSEQGFNSNAGDFDTKRVGQYTHNLQVSDLKVVSIAGTQYYSFLIDVNESTSAAATTISLDALKIFTSATGSETATTQAGVEALGTKRFDLDQPVDNVILYDDADNGSGQADILFLVPVSAFAGANLTDYVYMYQAWGGYSSPTFNGSSDGGFEETIAVGATPVPEVTAFLPLAGVLGMAVGAHQWRRRKDLTKTTEFAAA